MLNLAVFVSGRGSNLKAILENEDLKNIITIVAVISDKQNCAAFDIAKENNITTFYIGNKEGNISFEKLVSWMKINSVELIVLAGFLKLIPSYFVGEFRNKIINIHPALLPSFGGKGMYGMNVHKAVFQSSSKVSGPTVHFVDEYYDTGGIIAQQCVDISSVNSPEEIAEKVLKEEHKILPYVIKKIIEGKVIRTDNRVVVLE
ncbi:MAG: phosphoribosylglycinamide formyltransferase [Ignavibacteria bacterium CG2_30_36_16]|nr:phosphoribosylglycinamide formyltransferase [Ignavibacteria bacterium]OIP63757.1 MAG: phosphoribosylglycinamide formyltransferase [Ignavibacteria bacterium CG2_30_36_16]PJB01422.1 MAG: phosphoribosylglycinamide formyltransferase [Ignavibacteria bacterium CG_4_9_14_3_um_filter_36_18]